MKYKMKYVVIYSDKDHNEHRVEGVLETDTGDNNENIYRIKDMFYKRGAYIVSVEEFYII